MSNQSELPEEIYVYAETGDTPIRYWGRIKDHKQGWRTPHKYLRADRLQALEDENEKLKADITTLQNTNSALATENEKFRKILTFIKNTPVTEDFESQLRNKIFNIKALCVKALD